MTWCPRRSEEGTESRRTGAPGSCEPYVGAEN